MENTNEKSPGQVALEAATAAQTPEITRVYWTAIAAAVIAHDKASRQSPGGVLSDDEVWKLGWRFWDKLVAAGPPREYPPSWNEIVGSYKPKAIAFLRAILAHAPTPAAVSGAELTTAEIDALVMAYEGAFQNERDHGPSVSNKGWRAAGMKNAIACYQQLRPALPVAPLGLSEEARKELVAGAEQIYDAECGSAAFDYLLREIPARLSPLPTPTIPQVYVTSERPPTEADGDSQGMIRVANYGHPYWRGAHWTFIDRNRAEFALWYSVPQVPPAPVPAISAEESAWKAHCDEGCVASRASWDAALAFAAAQKKDAS